METVTRMVELSPGNLTNLVQPVKCSFFRPRSLPRQSGRWVKHLLSLKSRVLSPVSEAMLSGIHSQVSAHYHLVTQQQQQQATNSMGGVPTFTFIIQLTVARNSQR